MFALKEKIPKALGRAGVFATPSGEVETPAFVPVGTKASVKALTPAQLRGIGAAVVLGNTYHLHLEPGEHIVAQAGGLARFMGWDGPTMTDSGGFQAFSLGSAFGRRESKIASLEEGAASRAAAKMPREAARVHTREARDSTAAPAQIDEDGVTFRSLRDGSAHRFTPEKSIEIQRALGADVMFAFDECSAPTAPYDYQEAAMERTHRWATRSLAEHRRGKNAGGAAQGGGSGKSPQFLFGIVQGGRFEALRRKSARAIGAMGFDGFGIGGSFDKEDIGTAVRFVSELLPEEKPRHLLGIGEPLDLLDAVENGCDLFDCVAPTRQARNGALYTAFGKINIGRAQFRDDFSAIDEGCCCYACAPRGRGGGGFTKAYLSHLFRSGEILANTLATIHNLHFTVRLVKLMRQAILDGRFGEFKENFLRGWSNSAP